MNAVHTVLRVFLFLLFFLPGTAFTNEFHLPAGQFSVPMARTAAIGGLHAALADDVSAVFMNPAGFLQADQQLSISRIGAGFSGPVFSLAGLFMKAGSDDMGQIVTSPEMKEMLSSFYSEAQLNGPFHFAYVGGGLGFGIFNTSRIIIQSAGGASTSLNAEVREQLLLCGGYTVNLPVPESWSSTLDAGLLLKGFINGDVSFSESIFNLTSFLEAFTPDALKSRPFTLTSGIGLDLGLRYQFRDFLAVGLVGRNVYTPAIQSRYGSLSGYLDGHGKPVQAHASVPQDLSLGLLFTPRFRALERYISDMKILLDYRNMLDFLVTPAYSRNPVLHAAFGVEIVLLDILSLRSGLNEGLFSAGFGLDLSFFSLQAAMYGRELSSEPGMHPVFNMALELDLSL